MRRRNEERKGSHNLEKLLRETFQARKIWGTSKGIQLTLLLQDLRGNLRCKVQLGPGGQTQDELTRSLPEG